MKTTRITFPIDNLRCGGALIVERALTRTPGAVHVYVNPALEMAYVEYDSSLTDSDHLVAAIERTGFRAGVPSIR
jgi:copper chaperone CopZ